MRRRRRSQRRWWIASAASMLVMIGWLWWGGDADGATEARPPIPHAGAQRNELLAEMKRLNQQVADLNRLVRSGGVVVTVKDAKPDAKRAR